jgi:hypothetical protein
MPGGRRAGAGRPSNFQREQKAEALKKAEMDRAKRREENLEAAWEQVERQAAAGEKWAIQMLIEHEQGRPGTKQQQHADTEIVIAPRFPVHGKIAIGQKLWDYADVVKACKTYRPEDVIEETDGEIRDQEPVRGPV